MAEREHLSDAPFQWIPGHGPDPQAISRLTEHFPRPEKAMGEAWFMGETRTIYGSLLDTDIADWPVEELETILVEIAMGLPVFGHADNWADWYGYLLPRCIPRAFEYHIDYLVEHLVTACMAVMPSSSTAWGYPSFRNDALATLGKAIMAPALWPNGPEASVGCLHSCKTVPTGYPIWGRASGDFSASMFFCLKYVSPEDMPAWTKSVFAIPCPRWRAQVLVWLVGAKAIVDGTISQPSKLDKQHTPDVGWHWSHCIDGQNAAYQECVAAQVGRIEFLPMANRMLFSETVANLLDENLLSEWLESMMEFEYLFDQITAVAVPEQLRQLYRI